MFVKIALLREQMEQLWWVVV